MQIVIDISEELYERIKYLEPVRDSNQMLDVLMCKVQDAIPLPKGHGRLIDADEFEKNLMWNENIDNAPTILEAGRR